MSASPFPEVALSELASIKYGYTESASSEQIGPKFLRITDIQDGSVDWDSVPYCAIDVAEAKKHQLEDGDIVFARTGATTGKSFLIKEPPNAVPASYLIRLRLTGKKLLPQFLSLFFQTEAYWHSIEKGSSGSAQGGFNASKLGQLKVPTPPLEEQKRIVAVLDQAFAALDRARALAEANLADAEALFQAALQEMFATKVVGQQRTLREVCSVITDGTHNAPPYVDHGIPMLDTKNIGDNLAIAQTSASKFISKETDALLAKRCKPQTDDVLVSSRGTIGKLAIVHEGQNFNIMGNIILLRPKPELRPLYLAYRLMAEVIKIQDISRGAAQKGLYLKPMREYPVQLPDLETQDEIIAQLDRISDARRQLKADYEGKLFELADLRKSLLHKAFAGELT